jgi:molybdenum cofactor cytidylyltransferase
MIAATVLAAGASTRMGSPKALLRYRGRPFLQSILSALEQLGIPCYVALGHDSHKILSQHDLRDITVVMNEELEAGPIGSIRAAIRAMGEQQAAGLLVWPVDFPHVRLETVQALIDRFAEEDEPAIVVPEYGDKSGHPVIFGRTVFDELLDAPNEGGARTIVRRDAARVARVQVSDPAVIDMVNTPESYRALLRPAD